MKATALISFFTAVLHYWSFIAERPSLENIVAQRQFPHRTRADPHRLRQLDAIRRRAPVCVSARPSDERPRSGLGARASGCHRDMAGMPDPVQRVRAHGVAPSSTTRAPCNKPRLAGEVVYHLGVPRCDLGIIDRHVLDGRDTRRTTA